MAARHRDRVIEEAVTTIFQFVKQLRRRRRVRGIDKALHRIDCLGIRLPTLRHIYLACDHADFVEYYRRPCLQRDLFAIAKETERGITAFSRRVRLIARRFIQGYGIERRTFFKETVNKECLHEPHRVLVDTGGIVNIDIKGANFDVLDATSLECRCRPFTGVCDTLRSNRTVIFIFDLQLVGRQLPVFSVHLDADILRSRAPAC